MFKFLKKIFNIKEYDVNKRANEIHEGLPDFAQDKATTAVGLTMEEFAIVGSSAGRLRPAQRALLIDGQYEADAIQGQHAEQNVINEAQNNELTITEMGASILICSDCEQIITENNITPKTAFSGKKSKKRKP